MKLRALHDKVLVHNMEKGERRTAGGLILRDDDGRDEGVRPRWAQVFSVGSEVHSVKPGDWVLLEHGKWTRTLEVTESGETVKLWGTTEEYVLLVADEKPVEFKSRF